jgi:hypothetical protein
MKGINTAGQALHPPQAAALAASRGVLNRSVPHSLDHARASTVAISLRSSIKTSSTYLTSRLFTFPSLERGIHENSPHEQNEPGVISINPRNPQTI